MVSKSGSSSIRSPLARFFVWSTNRAEISPQATMQATTMRMMMIQVIWFIACDPMWSWITSSRSLLDMRKGCQQVITRPLSHTHSPHRQSLIEILHALVDFEVLADGVVQCFEGGLTPEELGCVENVACQVHIHPQLE